MFVRVMISLARTLTVVHPCSHVVGLSDASADDRRKTLNSSALWDEDQSLS